MAFIKLYNYKPKIGEYINFIFTEHKDDYLVCNLIDYNLGCIMTFHCLTSKKKIKSLKSLAPLNKQLIGIIENIDGENIELNKVNVNKNSEEYDIFVKNNQKNHILKKFINQYVHKFNKNIDTVLEDNIYNLKIKDNSNYLDQIINLDRKNDFDNYMRLRLDLNIKKENEFNINIKCKGDINNIIKLFDETIEKSKIDDINIIHPKIGEYLISSNFNLEDFFKLFKNNILKYNDLILN